MITCNIRNCLLLVLLNQFSIFIENEDEELKILEWQRHSELDLGDAVAMGGTLHLHPEKKMNNRMEKESKENVKKRRQKNSKNS